MEDPRLPWAAAGTYLVGVTYLALGSNALLHCLGKVRKRNRTINFALRGRLKKKKKSEVNSMPLSLFWNTGKEAEPS